MNTNTYMTRLTTWIGLTAALTVLSGCADYMARHDGVTFDAGNAAARNIAIHTIDPWPRHAANTAIDADGKRMLVAMKKYQANEDPDKAAAPKAGNSPGSQKLTNN